jgi:hypothetical protein
LQLHYHTHGGLTPAAPDPGARYAPRIGFPLRVGCHYHGGLTVAALVNVRSHTAKIVISSAIERRATKSGWRKPAVVSETCL